MHVGHYLSTLWGDWTVPADAKYQDAIPLGSYQSGSAEAYQCSLLPRGAELQQLATGQCVEWHSSGRWAHVKCGASAKWIFGSEATVPGLAQHISNTEGRCFERRPNGQVVLVVCRSSSQEQKWVHPHGTGKQHGVVLQAEGNRSRCLSVGGQAQLVVEECSVLQALHSWRWYKGPPLS